MSSEVEAQVNLTATQPKLHYPALTLSWSQGNPDLGVNPDLIFNHINYFLNHGKIYIT